MYKMYKMKDTPKLHQSIHEITITITSLSRVEDS